MVTIFAPVLVVGLVLVLIIGWRLRAPGMTVDPPGMRTFASFARGEAPAGDGAGDGAAGDGAAGDGAAGEASEPASEAEGEGASEAEGEAEPAARGAEEIGAIAQGLAARGLGSPMPFAEDYGHAVDLTLDGERFRLRLGWVGDEPEQFLLMIEPLLGIAAWREGRYHGRALGRLLGEVDAVLREQDDLRALRWHRREDWSEGRYDAWADGPIDRGELGPRDEGA